MIVVMMISGHSGEVPRRSAIANECKQYLTVQTQNKLNNKLCSVSVDALGSTNTVHLFKNSCRNSGKTVPMSPRLTVWAHPPLITVLAHFGQFLPQRVAVRGVRGMS